MGGGSYDYDVLSTKISAAKLTGASMFAHDSDITSGKTVARVHAKLDVSIPNSFGKLVRESFDSKEHPESLAIAFLGDVTGSMKNVPKVFIEKLGSLMKLLIKKGYVTHPHILFGGYGDAFCDSSPIQIGQFESSNLIDETLSLIHLEGGGGGQDLESAELSMYYMARHVEMDCFNKRGKKGYLFFSGDEKIYPVVKKEHVKKYIGDDLQADIPLSDIIKELNEKFEVFWIMPNGSSHFNNPSINTFLKNIFGERFLKLENPEDVCELIASTIGCCEGYDLSTVAKDLSDVGADSASVSRAITSLTTFAKSRVLKKVASSKGLLAKASKATIERL